MSSGAEPGLTQTRPPGLGPLSEAGRRPKVMTASAQRRPGAAAPCGGATLPPPRRPLQHPLPARPQTMADAAPDEVSVAAEQPGSAATSSSCEEWSHDPLSEFFIRHKVGGCWAVLAADSGSRQPQRQPRAACPGADPNSYQPPCRSPSWTRWQGWPSGTTSPSPTSSAQMASWPTQPCLQRTRCSYPHGRCPSGALLVPTGCSAAGGMRCATLLGRAAAAACCCCSPRHPRRPHPQARVLDVGGHDRDALWAAGAQRR